MKNYKVKIIGKTPVGEIESDWMNLSQDQYERILKDVRSVDVEYLSFKVNGEWTFVPSQVVLNSIWTIIEQESSSVQESV